MIHITNAENNVHVNVKLKNINYTVVFNHARTAELDALLLKKELQDALTQELSKMQRYYYELGWKEKSSKKVQKRTYFGGYFSI